MHSLGKRFILIVYLIFYSYSHLVVYSFILSMVAAGLDTGIRGETREYTSLELGQLDAVWEAEGDWP